MEMPAFMAERSYLFLVSMLYKSKWMLLYSESPIMTLFIEDYAGVWFHALFLIRPLESFDIGDLNRINSFLQNQWFKSFIIRNLPENSSSILWEGREFSFLSMDKAYLCFGSSLYQLESNYGQVIYCMKDIIVSGRVKFYKNNTMDFNIFEWSGFSSYRYALHRLYKKYFPIYLNENPTKEELRKIVDTWKENMEHSFKDTGVNINNTLYSYQQYLLYWYYPITSFLDFIYENSTKAILIKRVIGCELGYKWYRIGCGNGNSLIVYTFISDRGSSLFADIILLDIINYAINNGFLYINLWWSEDIALFRFKSKYLHVFKWSFIRETEDFWVTMDVQ